MVGFATWTQVQVNAGTAKASIGSYSECFWRVSANPASSDCEYRRIRRVEMASMATKKHHLASRKSKNGHLASMSKISVATLFLNLSQAHCTLVIELD